MIWVHAILLKPPRGPSPSVLAFQWFAWPRKSHVESRSGHLLLSCHCVLISIILWMHLWYGATKCISLVVPTWSVFSNLHIIIKLKSCSSVYLQFSLSCWQLGHLCWLTRDLVCLIAMVSGISKFVSKISLLSTRAVEMHCCHSNLPCITLCCSVALFQLILSHTTAQINCSSIKDQLIFTESLLTPWLL